MDDRLCLMTVHAHPDDEASKGAGSVAKYHSQGVYTVLVCCTGGEAGDILNPDMDSDEVRANLHQVRMQELELSSKIIGYDEVVQLGYRDSGMPGSDKNYDVRCFGQARVDEAVGRLVTLIRRLRPQVIVTYPTHDRQQRYPHPDHLMVHTISVAAFDAAGDPDAHPWAGPAWQPLKLYYTTWSAKRMVAMHEKLLELGLESPFGERIQQMREQTDDSTTKVDISEFWDVPREALIAHATQVRGDSRFWGFGLPPEVAKTIYPLEDFVLARSHVATEQPEDDLFAGIREPARKARPARTSARPRAEKPSRANGRPASSKPTKSTSTRRRSG